MGLASLATVAFVGSASAVMTNMGVDREMISHGHVLTPPASSAVGRILCAPSEADDAAFRAALSVAAGGAVVDYYDARVGTPSVALLLEYDCVYTWANFAYLDATGFGNNLADYVDAPGGGSVVLGVFCTYTSGNELAGRIMTPGYSPVVSPFGTNWFTFAAYAGNGTTCIHTGVTAYGSTYRDVLALQGPGLVDGNYTDGEIAHAYRPDFRVVYSNGSSWVPLGGTGDWPLLVANACACATPTATETTNWGSVKALFR
jgi:hypothetical protein